MLLSRHQTFTLTRIAFLAFALTSQAQAVIFTVNPNAIGVGDSSFTADSLLVSEVSHIQFIDALGDFTEAGYGYVTGADLNGNSVTTTGLGTDYTLYFQFTDQGGGTTLSSGTINFFAVAGTSTFGVSNNVAFVDNNGNTPSPLGNTTMSGTVGGDPSTALTAYATSPAFEFNSSGAVFFGLSTTQAYSFTGNFYHDTTPGKGVTFASDYSYVNIDHNGSDTVSFTSVPENDELTMLLIGLPLLTLASRRQKK